LIAFVLGRPAHAGELRISWNPSLDERTAGYHVYVGSESGRYTRVVEAGADASATIGDLADGQTCFVMVKGHDATGAETGAATTEPASLPRPRVESDRAANDAGGHDRLPHADGREFLTRRPSSGRAMSASRCVRPRRTAPVA
jgi:hypothetical protein